MNLKLQISNPVSSTAFTLIELLVVVTIIVTLLALLAPALDRAIYQAELAGCGAQLKGVCTGAVTYAMANGRRFPYRPAVYDPDLADYQPRQLTRPFGANQKNNPNGYDDRPVIKDYINIQSLLCPPAGKVQLTAGDANSQVYGSFSMFFGWKYRDPAAGVKGMMRIGDRIGYYDKRYPILAGDYLYVDRQFGGLNSSHPDALENLSVNSRAQDDNSTFNSVGNGTDPDGARTFASWGAVPLPNPYTRYRVDLNFGYDDGSITRFDGSYWQIWAVGTKEKRFDPIGAFITNTTANLQTIHMPKAP